MGSSNVTVCNKPEGGGQKCHTKESQDAPSKTKGLKKKDNRSNGISNGRIFGLTRNLELCLNNSSLGITNKRNTDRTPDGQKCHQQSSDTSKASSLRKYGIKLKHARENQRNNKTL